MGKKHSVLRRKAHNLVCLHRFIVNLASFQKKGSTRDLCQKEIEAESSNIAIKIRGQDPHRFSYDEV